MIRKFIRRVFTLGTGRAAQTTLAARPAAAIPVGVHGIHREQISEGSRKVCETLQKQGFKAYVVGGAVRDLLIGVTPKDFDVATDAPPEEVRRVFRRARVIGRRFQIVHVYMGREIVEVTTFRADVKEHGEAVRADVHGRLLRDNVFGTLAEDAARRDFTVNALYFDPASEQILDFHHGVADLKQKTLRMIGDPPTRYREDPVRMLRAVRLAAKLGLAIDPAARRPIREMASLLENVPTARLFDEMLKLFASGYAVRCLQELRAEGLHRGILPVLDDIFAEAEGERFIMGALANTDARIRQGKTSSPSFLFAALLWPLVRVTWERGKAAGEASIPALYLAMGEVLDLQSENLAVTRRIASDIKEIWGLQPRFDLRAGKRPYGLLAHPRFRAAYDFLALRVEAGELAAEVLDWWTHFQNAEGEARAALLLPETSGGGKTRRRRRRKKPAAEAVAESSETGT
ncbi:MAG: polynucleotide adenylyltransferase PcnB [Zoogloeaceae bacterium]|jgi:poly(A) polymerase|nr:polynucleotide adenylyltransferase PcnB [Zoogloeaceae bacterium]